MPAGAGSLGAAGSAHPVGVHSYAPFGGGRSHQGDAGARHRGSRRPSHRPHHSPRPSPSPSHSHSHSHCRRQPHSHSPALPPLTSAAQPPLTSAGASARARRSGRWRRPCWRWQRLRDALPAARQVVVPAVAKDTSDAFSALALVRRHTPTRSWNNAVLPVTSHKSEVTRGTSHKSHVTCHISYLVSFGCRRGCGASAAAPFCKP